MPELNIRLRTCADTSWDCCPRTGRFRADKADFYKSWELENLPWDLDDFAWKKGF